ncbi:MULTISPECIES: hypothetical protein [Pseudoalteromonas]|uniref:Uncharacterized protein n=3 Tax=Pseudoalteromonas TaxID=53246 RepID=A0AAD0RH37_PSEO7|nr:MULTISPECIES: hypothetical protein [Pseudoalteromonas]ASD67787.1 hypothetical protein B1L02_12670 [Pseudoalteromonas piscicida]ATD05507.1 hypothetical protein PPIS_a0146 [Pseudoalteromonas piscicida]AXR01509.1 hypothetical protein D0511_05060 [Pseudoalteromonas piscicida]KJY92461.1 hypothetical protein TW75_01845 [Pseudoalteromonas piscicida]TMN38239.1 hypothetical protein CWB95_14205 [Pseudoalteromonas piscicida]
MKLSLKKRNMKVLNKDNSQIAKNVTLQIAGGYNRGYTDFYFCGTTHCPSAYPECETMGCNA